MVKSLVRSFKLLITIAKKTSLEVLNETHWSDKAENKTIVYNVTGTKFNDFDVNHFNIFRPCKKNILATRPSTQSSRLNLPKIILVVTHKARPASLTPIEMDTGFESRHADRNATCVCIKHVLSKFVTNI